jgi:hypothetical protein
MNIDSMSRNDKICLAIKSQYPNISGAMVGLREVDGKWTDEIVLKVHVSDKIPESFLKPSEVLPREFMGMRVDVEEKNVRVSQCGCAGRPAVEAFTGAQAVLMPGSSIGGKSSGGTGTLACVLRKGEQTFGLTNWHVVSKIGDEVVQPGPVDAANARIESKVIGVSMFDAVQMMDVCAFKLNPGIPWVNRPIGQAYEITDPVQVEIGQIYQKVGRTTELTQAVCVSIGFIRVQYSVGPRDIYVAEFAPVDPSNPRNDQVSEPGDSGSMWTTGSGQAVALHAAGSSGIIRDPSKERGFACPIIPVLDFLKMQVAKGSTVDLGDSSRANAVIANLRAAQTRLAAIQDGVAEIDLLLGNSINILS